MNLPYDSLREAILLELNKAISIRRAQGVSFETLRRDFGLSKRALYQVRGHYRLNQHKAHGQGQASKSLESRRLG